MRLLRRPRSLKSGVALVSVTVLAGWVIVVAIGINVVVANRLNNEAGDLLRFVAQEAAATVDVSADGTFTTRSIGDNAVLDVGTWIFHGTQIVQGPVNSHNLDALAGQLTGRGRAADQTGGSDGIRWYAEPISNGVQQVGTVVTALSLAPYQATGQYTVAGTTVLALLLLVGAYLALRAGVGRALRPVEQMTNHAAQWSTTEVERRFGDERRPAELDRLAVTLDGLLDRMSAVLRNERQFSAEISHELRTPLARALADVQLLRLSTENADFPGLESIEVSLKELVAILDTLMSTARLQILSPPGRCDAVAVVNALVGRAAVPPPMLMVVCTGPAVAGVDGLVLERALSPVLDNARRYASSRVDIEVGTRRGSVRIEIRDDGPGIPDGELTRIFDPGYRTPSPSPDGHQGAGLGLALARRLIAAVDGTITVANGPGAVFTVLLPSG